MTLAALAVGFGAGRVSAPNATHSPDAAIGTAVAKYPPCESPRWTPGRTIAGPCAVKP